MNTDSNVIAGVQARTTEILSKGDTFVTLNYSDIAQHWAMDSIKKLTKLRVINGYPNGGFKPDEQITRAEFAAMIDRAFVDMASRKVSMKDDDFTAFRDINGRWSTDSLKKLVKVGVLNGYEDGTIRPEKTISRQEMALIITRVLNANILKVDTSKVQFTDLGGAYGADAIKRTSVLGIFNGKAEHTFDPNSGATRAEAIETIINTYSLSPTVKQALMNL
ncbi:S-layer homology domain-containing protein [Paenibacillus sp. JX-17]|uniref:S-layer homology domain-containing protein n=1 Tax=Paenibacillus lacisoli TaxID=3064525 RepID=A0ABT9CEL8_9BACL|nr:S-layer homology domain-containing protein [Paenibacillus sp. JX-17]MDO7907710.1 S-layer homology domain-containing protein [Paenibacillus sp. JX-17]